MGMDNEYECGMFDGHGIELTREELEAVALLVVKDKAGYVSPAVEKELKTLSVTLLTCLVTDAHGGNFLKDAFDAYRKSKGGAE